MAPETYSVDAFHAVSGLGLGISRVLQNLILVVPFSCSIYKNTKWGTLELEFLDPEFYF
jgi:hypothetical protein